jgi:tetratricopeptide (TPR) repeat protein
LEKQEFSEAIALLKRSLELDHDDEPARNNLLAAHNNCALALCDQGDYNAASEKLAQGRAIDAKYGPLQTNDLYIHQKWVLHLCEKGRYSDAVDILEAGYQRRPESPLFDNGRYAIYGLWSKALLDANRVNEAFAVLDDARRRYGVGEPVLDQELQTLLAAIKAKRAIGDRSTAEALRKLAIARHPNRRAEIEKAN